LNQIENQRVARLGSMEGIAEQLADYEVFYGDANIINSISERTQAITAEKLLEVAQKYFDPNKRIILYYLPKKDS
jgi:predicted Zn-dependent peptidase